jgi:putative phosphoribosyl transferase
MMFRDRREAGRLLAEKLGYLKDRRPVVLALPRGGVPVGLEIARALGAPLDLTFVRKLGAPGQEELAVGAIADGSEPETITDEALASAVGIRNAELASKKDSALEEIERRRKEYLGERPRVPLAGRTVIVVDDGIATGATMTAAIRVTRKQRPSRVVVAVPVAPPDVPRRLREEADDVVCLYAPVEFLAVGQFYRQFEQLSDQEVVALLAEADATLHSDRMAGEQK